MLDQLPALRRQVDHQLSAVILLPFALHPSVLFKIVHHQRNISAASQKLLPEGVLAHWPEVQQCFEHSKLPQGQAAELELSAHSSKQGISSSRQIDVRIERPQRIPPSFIMRWHTIQLSQLSHAASSDASQYAPAVPQHSHSFNIKRFDALPREKIPRRITVSGLAGAALR